MKIVIRTRISCIIHKPSPTPIEASDRQRVQDRLSFRDGDSSAGRLSSSKRKCRIGHCDDSAGGSGAITSRSVFSNSRMELAVHVFETLLVLFFLAGASRLDSQSPGAAEPAHLKPLTGNAAPNFAVPTADGKIISLADYRGRPALVNFWAIWCDNCKLEMPWLAELREKYASQGFEVLGILTNSASPEKIEHMKEQYGVKYPIVMCDHATAQAYGGLPDLPESFFIDRHGKIVAVMDGADSEEQIEANIRKALARH